MIVMTGCVCHHAQEKLSPPFAGTSSICRGDLAKTLLEKAARMPNVNVHFGCTLTGVDMDKRCGPGRRSAAVKMRLRERGVEACRVV